MYWFGRFSKNKEEWRDDEAWSHLFRLKREMALTPVEDIVQALHEFGGFLKNNDVFASEVLPELIKDSGLSSDDIKKTLNLLPSLLTQENLEKRLKGEFIQPKVLNDFIKLPGASQLTRAIPLGVVLHVTAGNVFLSSIDSLIMGLLTKNISILKVSSQNTYFPFFFARKLLEFDQKNILCNKFAVLHWKGGDLEAERVIKNKVDCIVAWGGEEMISAYRKDLPVHVKFLDFGPKISLQIISKNGLFGKDLRVVAQKIIQDIAPWDQGACASPQNLYVQENVDEKSLLFALNDEFQKTTKGGEVSEDESVEILKEKYRGFYSELMEDGLMLDGPTHLIHFEKNKFLKPSPLHRSLIVKKFEDEEDLFKHLRPFSYYLQSCSYLLDAKEKKQYLEVLALTGIKRFAPLGTITWGMEGAPHDGRFVLRELVHFIGDEARIQDYGETNKTIQNSISLKEAFDKIPHPAGYVFSSGGTTGEPKYTHYSYAEFDFMTDMLAKNLRAQGIHEGMIVANLFVAGNLWSSFMAVEKALEKIGAIQLPIGGLCSTENILMYLQKFRPDVVMGIPSFLVMNAEYAKNMGIELDIKRIIYAGESLSEERRKYLANNWKTQFFGSAGYASVDAGVIGYQCSHCAADEHHFFSELVELQIIHNQGVVTSLARDTMPIKNYLTGDRMEWIEDCECGRSDKRFKLLGRIDNVIQIWACRLLLIDVEKMFQVHAPQVLNYQVVITEISNAQGVKEILEICYESKIALNHDVIIQTLYEFSRDVKDSILFDEFKKNVVVTMMETHQIPRNPRTGKISLVRDLRY